MNFLEVFHINELHRHIKLMKDDLGDRAEKLPTRTTLSDYLHRLHITKNIFGTNLLGFKVLPSNKPNPYKVFWLPGTEQSKIKEKCQSIVASYKEPKKKGKTSLERIDNTVQARLDQCEGNRRADKILAPLKQKEKEENNTLAADNQRDYLVKQQNAIPTPATDKLFKDALDKEKKRKAQKIIKNTLAQQQRELTDEERKEQTLAIMEALEEIGIAIPNKQLERILHAEEKKLLTKQNRKDNLRITDDSFIDPTDNFVEFCEEIVETAEGQT